MSLPAQILAGLLVLALAFGAGWRTRTTYDAGKRASAALQASEDAREAERLITRNITRIATDANAAQTRIRADAAAARSELDGLRGAATAAAACPPAPVAAGSAPAGDAGVVLAELLLRAAGRAVELAEAADSAATAGRMQAAGLVSRPAVLQLESWAAGRPFTLEISWP